MINTDLENMFSGTAEALWQLGKDKSSSAWTKIVKMHSVGMLNTAKGILGDHFLAEDAVQNSFLQIRDLSAEYFRRENGENSIGKLSHQRENTIFKNDFAARSWIIRITYFVAKDMKKSRNASKERENFFTQNWVLEKEIRSVPDQELLEILQAEIEKLPEDLRLPVVLRFHCEMNFNQVGNELGLAVHVIRQRIQKAIEVLHAKISAIVGSSMSTLGIESLLNKALLLNTGVTETFFKNCVGLLDKPALAKMQLIPESNLLLQSSKFMVKGLVMLKILAILVVLVGTASVVVNSISSKEDKNLKQNDHSVLLAKENKLKIKNYGETENSIADQKIKPTVDTEGKLKNDSSTLSDAKSEPASPISETKKNDFKYKEILPYFSDKAMFALIIPDLDTSTYRYNNSTVSHFYSDPSVNVFGRIPLILKSFFSMETQPFSGELIKTILEKAKESFHCLGAQYSENLYENSSSFFIVGLLKNEEKSNFELFLQTIKPFQIETRKNKKGVEIITYQFAKDNTKFELIKQKNMVFWGNAGGKWLNNIENNNLSNTLNDKIITSDLYWRVNLISLMEKQYSRFPTDYTAELIKAYKEMLSIEIPGNIEGELYLQKTKISHKVFLPTKRTHPYAANDILVAKNITSEMIKKIPLDRRSFFCLNIDLQKSWGNYNAFMDYFFNKLVSIGGENFTNWKVEYLDELAKTDELCQNIIQMNINSLMEKCLSGEIISWVVTEPVPLQTVSIGVKDPELALKLKNGLEGIWGKDSGVKINYSGSYIDIILPVRKNSFFQDYQKSTENKSATIIESEIVNKNLVSWSDSSFFANHSLKLPIFNITNQNSNNIETHEDNDLLRLFINSVKSNATSIVITKNGVHLEFDGFDDCIQWVICSILLDKRNKIKNESIPIYTEIKGHLVSNGKPSEYIASKGYLLNEQKTGHWKFYNYKGEITDEGEFKNNKEIGIWKKTDWMGNIGEGEMIDGLQTGQWKFLHYHWKNPSYGEMKLGKKVGIWKAYHNKNNKLAEEGEYVDDKKVGTWIHYHDNGEKEFEEKYNENGLLDGERITWDEQGNILSTETLKNGQLNGFRRNFINQKLVGEEEASDGERLWSKTYFRENLNIKSEFNFDKNKAMEFIKEYHLSGQLKLSRQSLVLMKDGKREHKFPIPVGEWKEWYENNVVKMSGEFDNSGTGTHNWFYKNSDKCAEFNTVNGLLDGKAEGWYDNGNLFFSGGYKKGKINGLWKIYFANGNKEIEVEFKDGVISSALKIWGKNGEIKENLPFSLAEAMVNKSKLREYERKLKENYDINLLYNYDYRNYLGHDFPHNMDFIKRENSDAPKK